MTPVLSLLAALALSAGSADVLKGAGPSDFIAVSDIRPEFEVPPVTGVNAHGSAGFHYNSATGELSWEIEYEGLTSTPTGVHIHGPAMPGQNATIIVNLLANSGSADSPIVGSVVIDAGIAQTIADGLSYVNLHTMANTTGEARGQLEVVQNEAYDATLDSEITLVAAAEAQGSNTGDITITHGLPIQSGDVVLAFINQTLSAIDTISDNNGIFGFTEDIQENGGFPGTDNHYAVYSRVAGSNEPDTYRWTSTETTGVWRIQIRVYRGVDNGNIYDVPPLTANKTLGESITATTADITTTVDGARAVAFFFGDHSQGYSNITNGYTNVVANQTGEYTVTVADKEIATAGATGTVSANLDNLNDWATLHFALNPRGSGASAGTAFFQYEPVTDQLTWNIEFSGLSGTPTGVHIHAPAEPGSDADIVLDLLANSGGSDSPIVGSFSSPAPELLGYMHASRAYVNVHTAANPTGEVRGQIAPTVVETIFMDGFEGN